MKNTRKPNDKYKDQGRYVPQSVNDKFIIDGHKITIYIKNIKEVQEFIDFLDWDFVLHQSYKNPSQNYIQDTEFIVSCDYNKSVVVEYRSDGMANLFGMFNSSFEEDISEAVPLKMFFNHTEYPEYFI